MISFMVSRWVIYKFKIFIRMYSFKIRKFHTIYRVGKVWQLSWHHYTQCQNKKVYNEISDQLRYWYMGGGITGRKLEMGDWGWKLANIGNYICVSTVACVNIVAQLSTSPHNVTPQLKIENMSSSAKCDTNWK